MYFKQGVFENFLLQERESVNDFLSEKESLDIEAAELQHCLSIRCWLWQVMQHKDTKVFYDVLRAFVPR